MNIIEDQKTVPELLSKLADEINLYLGDNFINKITADSKISNPIITAIRKKKTENISLKTYVQIANAIGLKVTDIVLEKI